MKMKIMKKAFTIFVTAAMLLSPFGLASQFAAMEVYAEDSYNLWVGGVEVTSGNTTGDGWSFTPPLDGQVLGTLTLTEANITDGHTVSGATAGVYYGGTDVLNIVLKGENNIAAPEGKAQLKYGIFSTGSINISGSGRLSAEGESAGIHTSKNTADITISGGTITASGATAIQAGRNVEIEGGTVTATATGDNGNAIYAVNYVDLEDGSVTASGVGTGQGIYAKGIDTIGDNVVIWAGSSESNAVDVTNTFKNDFENYKWVHASACTLWVGGIPVTGRNAENILGDAGASASYDAGTKTLTLNNYSYEIEGHKFDIINNFYAAIYTDQDLEILLKGDNILKCTEQEGSVGFGIFSNKKALTISGNGTLNVAGYGEKGIGICTSYKKDIIINSGTVTASGDNGLSANGGSVIINDGIVTAIGSSNDLGISADSIVVADKMGINAGDSKETATGVDKGKFETYHPQQWVQVAKAYPLWVRGIWVMTSNRDDVLGDGSVSFDPDTNTLSLEGANITADAVYQKEKAAIYYEDEDVDLIIDSIKDSIVKGPESDNSNDESYGIFSKGPVALKGNLTVVGATRAIDALVKNSAIGLGWTNTEGTEGKKELKINEQGQDLGEDIRKAVFPAPKASVSKAPVGKSLTYNGSAQELVAAGAAENGAMMYALGKDTDTAPTEGWSSFIPVGTDAEDYFVWYRAEGDATHIDSEPGCVMVTIAKKPEPIVEKEEVKSSPKTGDESNMAGWILLLTFVVAATGVVARRRLRQK